MESQSEQGAIFVGHGVGNPAVLQDLIDTLLAFFQDLLETVQVVNFRLALTP